MPCGPRMKCLELRNLSKPSTPLKSVNFRYTTPGSGLLLVTKSKPQPTSTVLDPTHPGAHLTLDRRRSLAPRWVSPHFTLYAFPKAFLYKPDVRYSKPYGPRPYPAPARRPEQNSADMSMQFFAFKTRVVLRPHLRYKIKRRLKEAVKLIVTRGAAVEQSSGGPKLVFRAEDVGADKWIAPDWTYMALPTTAMFRMPFTEQLDLMRNALGAIRRRIPQVEEIFKCATGGNATSLVRSAQGVDSVRHKMPPHKTRQEPPWSKGRSPLTADSQRSLQARHNSQNRSSTNSYGGGEGSS